MGNPQMSKPKSHFWWIFKVAFSPQTAWRQTPVIILIQMIWGSNTNHIKKFWSNQKSSLMVWFFTSLSQDDDLSTKSDSVLNIPRVTRKTALWRLVAETGLRCLLPCRINCFCAVLPVFRTDWNYELSRQIFLFLKPSSRLGFVRIPGGKPPLCVTFVFPLHFLQLQSQD